jgi:peptidoglycan glycosyltransferase
VNKNIQNLSIVLVIMFFALIISTSIIQVFYYSDYWNNTWNPRSVYDTINVDRGKIFASDGTTIIAQSTETDTKVKNIKFQRSYPFGSLYSSVTGFYSIVNKSESGLESSFNDVLSGKYENAKPSSIIKNLIEPQKTGYNLITTLDHNLQTTADTAIGNYQGSIVILDADDGSILSMVSKPDYDPNLLASINGTTAGAEYSKLVMDESGKNPDPNSRLLNKATSKLYPPGSTFKTIISLTALKNDYKPDSILEAPDQLTLSNSSSVLHNFNNKACSASKTITLQEALNVSCNTAFSILGTKLGSEKVKEVAEDFGYNKPIVIDDNKNFLEKFAKNLLPSSSSGFSTNTVASVFPDIASDDRLELASIGQGDVRVTPLQNALTAAMIANGGKNIKPHFVSSITDSQMKTQTEFNYDTGLDLGSSKYSQLKEIMTEIVQKTPAYSSFKINGMTIGAKTGTAQTGNSDIPLAWVIGFANVDSNNSGSKASSGAGSGSGSYSGRNLAFALVVENGTETSTGANVAIPIMQKILGSLV